MAFFDNKSEHKLCINLPLSPLKGLRDSKSESLPFTGDLATFNVHFLHEEHNVGIDKELKLYNKYNSH